MNDDDTLMHDAVRNVRRSLDLDLGEARRGAEKKARRRRRSRRMIGGGVAAVLIVAVGAVTWVVRDESRTPDIRARKMRQSRSPLVAPSP